MTDPGAPERRLDEAAKQIEIVRDEHFEGDLSAVSDANFVLQKIRDLRERVE